MSAKKILLTKEWLAEIQTELTFLKEEKRLIVAEKLKEAISYWDLSENSEYEDARNEQAQVELKILELEDILKNYEIVDNNKDNWKKERKVNIWNTVKIMHVSDNHKWDTVSYKIVGTTESDIYENKISNESPIGKALLWHVVWDVVSVKSAAWVFEYEILELK